MAKFEVINRGGSIGSHDPAVMGEHDTIEQAREHAKRLTKQLTPGERNYYKMGYLVREKKATDSTRKAPARLHRALDAVLDARPVRDAGGSWRNDPHRGWIYSIDNWSVASAWPAKGVWFGMGDGGTRKKFKTEVEAKRYAESVAPANRARIKREFPGVRAARDEGYRAKDDETPIETSKPWDGVYHFRSALGFSLGDYVSTPNGVGTVSSIFGDRRGDKHFSVKLRGSSSTPGFTNGRGMKKISAAEWKTAKDSSRKAPARLHRALDAVLDARPVRAKDTVDVGEYKGWKIKQTGARVFEASKSGEVTQGDVTLDGVKRMIERYMSGSGPNTKAHQGKDCVPQDCLDLGTLAL
jgi:hypothetical protein